jgi:hypothetical protein
MELTSQQTLPVAQHLAWDALNDTAMLQASIPGCESITPTEPNQFDVAVTAAIGPVKAKFKGKLRLEDITPPTSYTIYFEGQGGAAGHGKGSATVRLESKGPHETLLHYTATASVGGKIAQVGSRLVDMAAQKMAGEFFANFTQALVDKHGVPTPAEEAAPAVAAGQSGVLARLLRWLKGLFGG